MESSCPMRMIGGNACDKAVPQVKRDHVVIGAGIVGVCVAYFLARQGRDVVLLERDTVAAAPPVSSSGVPARMFRSAYGRDRRKTKMCTLSLSYWKRFEQESGEVLFDGSGWVVFEAQASGTLARWPSYAAWPPPGFASESADVLRAEGLPHQWLSKGALVERFPQIMPNEFYDSALLDETAGLLSADKAVRAIGRLAEAAGAEIREYAPVEQLVFEHGQVKTVVTSHGDFHPSVSVVLAAGNMNPKLAPELTAVLRVVGENTMYVRPQDQLAFSPSRCPVIGHYAFPVDRCGEAHVSPGGSSDYEIVLDPFQLGAPSREEELDAAFVDATREILEAWVPDLAVAPLAAYRRCFYPVTRHGDYLLYRRANLVTLVACSSGTGFKTAPVAALIGADLAVHRDVEGFDHPLYSASFRLESALRS